MQALDLAAKGPPQLYVLDAGHGQDILAGYQAGQQTDFEVENPECWFAM